MEARNIVLTLRVSPEVNEWLEAKSSETQRPKSNYIYALLLKEMKKEKQP
jgi:predicted DNA-binding protein